ncbi:MAG: hypothetical protein GXX80_09045 [Thermotogaceae bacterium]|nr:hypothetical protein [Thermotogaceae bacterium]
MTNYLIIGRGIVNSMGFEGESCAISEVYAAVMTEILEGKSLEKAGSTIVISRK